MVSVTSGLFSSTTVAVVRSCSAFSIHLRMTRRTSSSIHRDSSFRDLPGECIGHVPLPQHLFRAQDEKVHWHAQGLHQAVDVELDLPLGFFARIDDDEIQVAVRPSGALGPRSEKDDFLGMDRFGDDLHYTLDHWIGAHVWPPVSSLVILAGPALRFYTPHLAQVVFGHRGHRARGGRPESPAQVPGDYFGSRFH